MANKIKSTQIKGRVKPIDLLAASKVNTIKKDPIIMSIFSGLPTLGAKTSGGSKGKYKAEITTKIERIISIKGVLKFFLL